MLDGITPHVFVLAKLLSDSELLSDSGDLPYLRFVVAIFYSVVAVQSRRVIDLFWFWRSALICPGLTSLLVLCLHLL